MIVHAARSAFSHASSGTTCYVWWKRGNQAAGRSTPRAKLPLRRNHRELCATCYARDRQRWDGATTSRGIRLFGRATASVMDREMGNSVQSWRSRSTTLPARRRAYLLPKFGPYDYFAIEWGYKQFTQIAVVDSKRINQVMSSDTEWGRLDQLAAQQVTNPMLRFGGEDDAAAVDPQVGMHVVGGDPIEAADLGLQTLTV